MSNPAAGAPGSLLWASAAATVDEALNQREFAAARAAFLASEQKQQPAAAVPQRKAPPRGASKGSQLSRADVLMAETRKMDARLAALRANMDAEKAKRPSTKRPTAPSSSAAAASAPSLLSTSASTRSRPASTSTSARSTAAAAGLSATIRAPVAAASRTGGSSSAAYKHVSSRVDTHNSFLRVKAQSDRAIRETEARRAAEEAAEARRIAHARENGHTLLTYAPKPAEPEQWILTHETEPVAAPASDLNGATDLAPAVSRLRPGARKQATAADVMRSRAGPGGARSSLAGLTSSLSTLSFNHAPAPASSSSIAASAAKSTPVVPARAPPVASSVSSSSASSSTQSGLASVWDGELDEQANASAFAAAREEFLRSLQGDGSTHTAVSSEQAADAASFLSSGAASSALPSGWWEGADEVDGEPMQQQAEEDEDLVAAAPGSLLDGPEFDERQSADDFQRAREEWMREQGMEPATAATAAPHAPTSAVATVAAAPVAPAAKASCYTCFRLFVPSAERGIGVVDAESGKQFCSEGCAESFRAEQRERCVRCARRVQRRQAQPRPDGWTCLTCCDADDQPAPSDLPVSSLPAAAPAPALAAAAADYDDEEPVVSLLGGDGSFLSSLANMRPLQPLPSSSASHAPSTRSPPQPSAAKLQQPTLDARTRALQSDEATISAWNPDDSTDAF